MKWWFTARRCEAKGRKIVQHKAAVSHPGKQGGWEPGVQLAAWDNRALKLRVQALPP